MDTWWLWVLIGYVCGSLPVGLLVGLARGVDVRQAGSGNIGATNVSRLLGRRWGVFCFVMDVLKGALPVLAAGWRLGLITPDTLPAPQAWRWLAVGAAAVLGHVFPVWLKFRGGKGVATGLGAVLGVWPTLTVPALAAAGTWLLFAGVFRYVSLASIAAAMMLPFYLAIHAAARGRFTADLLPFLIVTGAMSVLIVVRHRGNIRRLATGAESRIGQKPISHE